MDIARRDIRSLKSKIFSIDGLSTNSITQVLSFTININRNVYDVFELGLYCLVFLTDFNTRIQIENISSIKASNQQINQINLDLKLGVLKVLNSIPILMISHTFDHNLISRDSIPKYYKKILKKLIFNFNSSIKTLKTNIDKESEDEEELCNECELGPDDCLCQGEKINTDIRYIRVIPLIYNTPIRDLFDLSEIFYSEEHNIYTYEPSNLLDHQLKFHSLSQNFLANCKTFILKMSQSGLYFKSNFPKNLILCEITNHKINSISLAPALSSKSEFYQWFDLHPTNPPKLSAIKKNFETFIAKSICKSLNNTSFSPFDLINPCNFSSKSLSEKSSLLGSGGFAQVHKNSFTSSPSANLPKIELALKLPFKNDSEIKIKNRLATEYRAVQELSHPNIVKTYGVFQDKDSYGLCLEFLEGRSLKQVAGSMSSLEKIRAMTQVAAGLAWIHKHGYVHQDIKPSNVIISRNRAKIIDFGFALKEELVSKCTGFTLEYADPLHLKKMKPGKAADVWSWAITFISLFLDLEPYKGVLDRQVFRNKRKSEREKDDRDSNEGIERVWQEIYVKGRRPDFKRLQDELDLGLVILLKSCLSAKPENRPIMDDIVKYLNLSL